MRLFVFVRVCVFFFGGVGKRGRKRERKERKKERGGKEPIIVFQAITSRPPYATPPREGGFQVPGRNAKILRAPRV